MARGDQRRRGRHGSDQEQHGAHEAGDADADAGAASAQDNVRVWVDELSEKGKATRLHGLGMLADHLRRQPASHAGAGEGKDAAGLEGTLDTLLRAVPSLLRNKASEAEFTACCRLVEVLALVLGTEGKRALFVETYDPLRAAVGKDGKTAVRTGAAIRALAMLAALCSEDDGPFWATMEQAEALIADYVADEPKVAALQAWGFLASLADGAELRARTPALRAIFAPLLAHECPDVRADAGENLAMLIAMDRDADDAEDDEDEEESEEDKEKASTPNASSTEAESKVVEQGLEVEDASQFVTSSTIENGDPDAELVATLEDLAHQNEKNVTKRSLREQRARFRDILGSVRDGVDPELKLSLDKVSVQLEGWSELKRAGYLRDVLGEGLEAHTKVNAGVQSLLNLRGKHLDESYFAADGHLVGTDGAAFYGSCARVAANKQRNRSRHKARDHREAIKSDFLHAEASGGDVLTAE
ncbi:Interferon-related developmental regulator 1 [Hondaea fermentalgiana]|uniref:Interferon-related developmental regulator 1 n=1 Tax=Hondaea fermentalgiana TaxID=2315210 RepID=A0A2R5G830_9STRA|nr:Interferon-related developmental regulator 1 [Hondaea fermentalgiana]|eukprot:GBG26705.1 Interferon-related developmental regulator 1 [Hondaea fermentalgiana]